MKNSFKWGLLFVLIADFGFGSMGVLGKLAYSNGANTNTLLTIRFLVASLILAIYLIGSSKGFKVSRKELFLYFLLGTLGYNAVSLCYFSALNYTSAQLVAISFFMYPIFVMILSVLFFKEEITKNKVIALFLGLLGILIMVWPFGVKIDFRGVIISLIGGFIYAIYVLAMGSSALKNSDSLKCTFYINLFAALGFIFISGITHTFIFKLSFSALSYIGAVGFLSTAVAILAFFQGVKLIGPVKAALLANGEPLIAAVLGAAVLGERMTLIQSFGGLLILLSVFFTSKK